MPHEPEEAKLILNGGVASAVLKETCAAIYLHVDHNGHFPDATKLVRMANEIENKVFRFEREVLEQIGFEGPWPHALTFKD